MVVDDLAQLVLRILASREITIRQLAAKSRIHPSTLSRWLAGRRGMRVRDAERVMRELGIVYLEVRRGPLEQQGSGNAPHPQTLQAPRLPKADARHDVR